MAKKHLVRFKISSKEKGVLGGNLLVHPGGHLNSKTGETTYYFFEDVKYSENANTIITQFHNMLLDVVKPGITEVNFVLDNHSTNKCYAVIAYFDYIVSIFIYIILNTF